MISIIIPTYNEADQITNTIRKIRNAVDNHAVEIIIVDGGSTDDTMTVAKDTGAIVVKSDRKGRAAQMNTGALIATEKVLYFLHADSIPPQHFITYITNAISCGAGSGCFRLSFDYQHWFLQANCWFTRFNVNAVRFGDQSLFVTQTVFHKSGGFNENLLLMEDQEIIHRLKKHGRFTVMNAAVTTSARKYLDNGIYRMQAIFFLIWSLYYLGYSQQRILMVYRKLIRRHKL